MRQYSCAHAHADRDTSYGMTAYDAQCCVLCAQRTRYPEACIKASIASRAQHICNQGMHGWQIVMLQHVVEA
jgi:hypothetical protein